MEPKFSDGRTKYPMRTIDDPFDVAKNNPEWGMPNIVTQRDYLEHIKTTEVHEGFHQFARLLPWCTLVMVAPAYQDESIKGAEEGVYTSMDQFPETEVQCTRLATGERFVVYFRATGWRYRATKFNRAECEKLLVKAMHEMIAYQYCASIYGEIRVEDIPERLTWQRLSKPRQIGLIETRLEKPRDGEQKPFLIMELLLGSKITFYAQPKFVNPESVLPVDLSLVDKNKNRIFTGGMMVMAIPYQFSIIAPIESLNLREVFHPELVLATLQGCFKRAFAHLSPLTTIPSAEVSVFDAVDTKTSRRVKRIAL